MAAKASAKKAAAKKPAAARTAKQGVTKQAVTKQAPGKKTPATKTVAKKTVTKKSPAKKTPATRSGATDTRWTAKELRELRAEIKADIAQLEAQIEIAEAELMEMMQDAGDGAGDDQADAGAKTFEREQEISLANNARELLDQNRLALERMDDGTYGTCASCGEPIGKLRLQAAPRATLCLPCKTKEERR